jgi:hypothetical protein
MNGPRMNWLEYYRTAELEPPTDAKWRFWRIVDRGGRWRSVRPVRSGADLRRMLLRFLPSHVYHSANTFLNPRQVGPNEFKGSRSGYRVAQNVMLSSGIVVDIDFKGDVDETVRQAAQARDYLRQYGDPVVRFTGRGFHVWVAECDLDGTVEDPIRRLEVYRENRRGVVSDLRRMGVELDEEVTLNPKQVIRMEGSVNGNNGYICTRIDDIDGFRLDGVRRVALDGGRASRKAMTVHFQIAENGAGGEFARPKPPPQPSPVVSSRILGTVDRHVLILHRSLQSYRKVADFAGRLAEEEDLSYAYIFRQDKWEILTLKAMQEAEILRLLRRWRLHRDRDTYAKYRQNLLHGDRLVGVVEGGDGEITASRAHYTWIKNRFPYAALPRTGGFAGNGMLKVGVIEFG